jgi:hypothetical protein
MRQAPAPLDIPLLPSTLELLLSNQPFSIGGLFHGHHQWGFLK